MLEFQFVQSIFYPKNGESVLSQSTIETLVLNAAIDFFDNDQEGDQNTGLMKLSRTCCSILPSSIPAIKTHLNLIDATHILITDFHLAIDSYSKIMPIQIRLHEDRVKLFKPLIDLHPDLYVKKSLVSDLKLKLLGSDSESARSKAFINVWTAKAALACQDEEAAFHLCLETLNIVENSSKLFDEILSEILDLLTIIRNKSTDDLGYAILVAKTLTASKGSSYNSIIEYWRNSLFRLAIGGLARDSISDDAETIYNTIEDMRLDFSKESEQVEADSENCHDFLKSVGSPVGDSYVLKSEFEGHLSLLETDLRCLKVQNSLFHAQDRFSQKNYGEHSYSIAKELFSTDSRLSIAYLLSCDVVF